MKTKDKIEDDKLYVQTLQSFILLLRNWSCGSCAAEMKVVRNGPKKNSIRNGIFLVGKLVLK